MTAAERALRATAAGHVLLALSATLNQPPAWRRLTSPAPLGVATALTAATLRLAEFDVAQRLDAALAVASHPDPGGGEARGRARSAAAGGGSPRRGAGRPEDRPLAPPDRDPAGPVSAEVSHPALDAVDDPGVGWLGSSTDGAPAGVDAPVGSELGRLVTRWRTVEAERASGLAGAAGVPAGPPVATPAGTAGMPAGPPAATPAGATSAAAAATAAAGSAWTTRQAGATGDRRGPTVGAVTAEHRREVRPATVAWHRPPVGMVVPWAAPAPAEKAAPPMPHGLGAADPPPVAGNGWVSKAPEPGAGFAQLSPGDAAQALEVLLDELMRREAQRHGLEDLA